MTNLSKLKKNILALFLAVLLLFSGQFFLPTNFARVKAETPVDITSSSVRDDLASMGMDKLSYLSETKNIFITMSQYYDKENNLRTYLYINYPNSIKSGLVVYLSSSVMDSEYNINEVYNFYDLVFINNDSSWCKYEVVGLINIEETTRRYNIKSIGAFNGETEDSYFTIIDNIDQTFIYNGITNNSIQVFHQEVETITITDKVVAFYCFGDAQGGLIFPETNIMHPQDIYTDSWFIFFNTDKKLDDLIEVELTYTQYDYSLYQSSFGYTLDFEMTEDVLTRMKNGDYGSVYPSHFEKGLSSVKYYPPVTIPISPGKSKVSYTDKGWFGKYDTVYEELDNIMNMSEYKLKIGDDFVFTEYEEKYSWGVHFKDTTRSFDHILSGFPTVVDLKGSGMSDVAILRLKFVTDGLSKNCYAVDTPTSDFEGNAAETDKNENMLKKIIALIAVILICVVLGPFISPIITVVFQFLGKIFGWLFRNIWKILTFPFRLFKQKSIPKTRKRKR